MAHYQKGQAALPGVLERACGPGRECDPPFILIPPGNYLGQELDEHIMSGLNLCTLDDPGDMPASTRGKTICVRGCLASGASTDCAESAKGGVCRHGRAPQG